MRSLRVLIALLLGAGAASPGARAADGSASGQFLSRHWEVPVQDAYAFHDRSGLSFDEGAILVAVSNREIPEDLLDRYYYRRYVLDEYVAYEKTRVVYLELAPDGTYRGYSYFFESGDGCGFCMSRTQRSTVKLEGGRLKGKVSLKPKEEDGVGFEITLDVPIAPDDYGTPLATGGGEPGKAYLAYHAALEEEDLATWRRLASAELLAKWRAYEEEEQGKGEAFVAYLAENRPQTVQVRQGFVRGDLALLLVEGESDYYEVQGEVHLRRESEQWKIHEETLQLGLP